MANRESEFWVTMNDSVRLDASVCAPVGEAPEGGWPGLLFVHGHGEDRSKADWLEDARRYADKGYLCVSYSVRGQGGSEGLCLHLSAREMFDLQDMIDWLLAEQPVNPERLGVLGSSQGGWHSWMAAAHHPNVATVVPQNISTDMADFAVRDGCLSTWFLTRTMRRRIMTAGLQDLCRQWALEGSWDLIREVFCVMSPENFAGRIRCPVLAIHGWDDRGMPANGVIKTFNGLTVPKRLYLGAGGHEAADTEDADRIRRDLIERWLDHWLKDEPNGVMDEPAVLCARKPGGEHTALESFPAPDAVERTLYLRPDLTLKPEPPEGPALHSNVANVPLDPDYTLKSAIFDDLAGVAEGLRREETAFDGDPLDDAIEIAGMPRFTFHLLGNRPFLQVHAELYDVSADGRATRISRGHFGTRTAEPGRHLTVEIEGRAVLYRVEAGHRLRVVVSNYVADSVFPYFDPFCARLYHDNSRPSSMALPVLG